MADEPLYYIQNKGYCGNCLIWWRDGGHGYTTNVDEAWKVPKSEAERICRSRPHQDIPWPVAEVDAVTVRHVDSEDLRSLRRPAMPAQDRTL
jgi:hypothetical protein